MGEKPKLQPLLDDDLVGRSVFLDDYGVCRFGGIDILELSCADAKERRFFFIQSKGVFSRVQLSASLSIDTARRLLKDGVYVFKRQPHFDAPAPTEGNTELVRVDSLRLSVRLTHYSTFDQYGPATGQTRTIRLCVTNVSDLSEMKCVLVDDRVVPALVDVERLKEGDEVFLATQGKATITNLYGHPGNSGHFCQLRLANGEVTNISIEGTKSLYYLPYDVQPNEFDELNENKNELLLSPMLVKDSSRTSYTYYWREVNAAARYIVRLYAFAKPYNKDRLYHLTDIVLDRNTRYLILPRISGEFACKVIAEDREGNSVAIARAVKGQN